MRGNEASGVSRRITGDLFNIASWLLALVFAAGVLWGTSRLAAAGPSGADRPVVNDAGHNLAAGTLTQYFEAMCAPKPFIPRTGEDLKKHQEALRIRVLECMNLQPLPERVPLDVHQSEALDHPWCTVRRVYYQIWPGVYSNGLLYMPKTYRDRPAPAVLCPHGHWKWGNAYPDVQRRCLALAKMGFVVFSPTHDHYEDLGLGISVQTRQVWSNMRALDYLESLPEVDKNRIGCCGASGGSTQTSMLAALDPRVKAATLVGCSSDYREILFPFASHCVCNHFPRVMRFTDWPEIIALACPTALQFLTMNDMTRHFRFDNYPTILALYAGGGLADRVDCAYWPVGHSYGQPLRERTYWWMEKWLRACANAGSAEVGEIEIPVEPDHVDVLSTQALTALSAPVPENKGDREISTYYRNRRGFSTTAISSRKDWQNYRDRMTTTLSDLLGEEARLPRAVRPTEQPRRTMERDLAIERVSFPSEGQICIPALVLCRPDAAGRLPVLVYCDAAGKEKLLAERGPESPARKAEEGFLVVLPDVRFTGEFSFGELADDLKPSLVTFHPAMPLAQVKKERRIAACATAWERNSIIWGRPLPGMACTDIRSVLDGLASRSDADMVKIKVVSRDSGAQAIAVLFAAALDPRIGEIDVNLDNTCFEKRNLPLVPFVLEHGDILQWAALLADRKLTLRNPPPEAGSTEWLRAVAASLGNSPNLQIIPQP